MVCTSLQGATCTSNLWQGSPDMSSKTPFQFDHHPKHLWIRHPLPRLPLAFTEVGGVSIPYFARESNCKTVPEVPSSTSRPGLVGSTRKGATGIYQCHVGSNSRYEDSLIHCISCACTSKSRLRFPP